MKTLSERYEIQLSWNFSATSHGKGPVDGIGECLKRSATEKVKTRQCVVNDAKDLKFDVTFISVQDVIARERSLGLTEIFENAIPIRGIAEYHWVEIDGNSNLITKRYNSEMKPTFQEDTSEMTNEQNSAAIPREIESGMWYAVYWKPTHYWLLVELWAKKKLSWSEWNLSLKQQQE